MAYFAKLSRSFVNLERVCVAKQVEGGIEVRFVGEDGEANCERFQGTDAEVLEAAIHAYQELVENMLRRNRMR